MKHKEKMPAGSERALTILNDKPEFHGFTLDEIRYQRAVVALKKEFCKEQMLADAENLRNRCSVSGILGLDQKGKTSSKVMNVASALFGRLNYVEYAMIGFSLFTSVSKLLKAVRRHKKS